MADMPQLSHTHIFSIVHYLKRFLLLLILPLVRGFLTGLSGGLVAWLSGAWFDIIVVLVIITLACLNWYNFKYYMDKDWSHFTHGIFFHHETRIPMDKISMVCVTRPAWLRPVRAVQVRVDTIARRPRAADFTFYVSPAQASDLLKLRVEPTCENDGVKAQYRPPVRSVVLLSLLTSNWLPGIVLAATFIRETGEIIGTQLYDLFFSTFESLARYFAGELPPITAGIALVLLGGWFIAFCYNLLQTQNLLVRRTEQYLNISGGVINAKQYSLRFDDICFVDIRQSLLTRLFRLYSVYLNAVGLGKERTDISAILPFARKAHTDLHLGLLLPEFKAAPPTIRPNPGAALKFLLFPACFFALIPTLAYTAAHILPSWSVMIRFTAMMSLFPAMWFFLVRLIDFLSCGLARNEDFYTICYSKAYQLHSVICKSDKVIMVHLQQSILQRSSDRCDLFLSTRSERRTTHHLRNLSQEECMAFFAIK